MGRHALNGCGFAEQAGQGPRRQQQRQEQSQAQRQAEAKLAALRSSAKVE